MLLNDIGKRVLPQLSLIASASIEINDIIGVRIHF